LIFFFDSLATTPSNITFLLFGPLIEEFTSLTLDQITLWADGMPVDIAMVILIVGYIFTPTMAAILSGKFGKDKIQAFGG